MCIYKRRFHPLGILREYIWIKESVCSEPPVGFFQFHSLLSDRLMMNSQAELITAAVWLLAVHLLRPLNCNPSKKKTEQNGGWLTLTSPSLSLWISPLRPLLSTAVFNSPEAHEIKFAHIFELFALVDLFYIYIFIFFFSVWDELCLLFGE